MNHTAGPWRIYHHQGDSNSGHYDGYLKIDILAGSDLIHIRQSVAGKTFPELSANARLIAACPELLEACKLALKECVDLIETEAGEKLEAAITKAEGGK